MIFGVHTNSTQKYKTGSAQELKKTHDAIRSGAQFADKSKDSECNETFRNLSESNVTEQ